MLLKRHSGLTEVEAADRTRLCEVLHPERDGAPITYSIAHAILPPGQRSLPHALANREVYYILAGSGTMHIGDEAEPVVPGDAVFIPERAVQWIENTGETPLQFLCIVDPPWSEAAELVNR